MVLGLRAAGEIVGADINTVWKHAQENPAKRAGDGIRAPYYWADKEEVWRWWGDPTGGVKTHLDGAIRSIHDLKVHLTELGVPVDQIGLDALADNLMLRLDNIGEAS